MEDHKSEIEDWDLGGGIYISFYLLRSSLQGDDSDINKLVSILALCLCCVEAGSYSELNFFLQYSSKICRSSLSYLVLGRGIDIMPNYCSTNPSILARIVFNRRGFCISLAVVSWCPVLTR